MQNDGKVKAFWLNLVHTELYCLRSENEENHRTMHSLVGTFVQDDELKKLCMQDENETTDFYPFKIIFPINKVRVYYCTTKEQRDEWVSKINQKTKFRSIIDVYELKQDLGKGKFGIVKLAVHKKTLEKVAIKVIKKRDVPMQELELQRREIEVLKLC